MKYILASVLILVALASTSQGQDKFSILPVDELLVTVVPQLACPLKIEDAIPISLPNRRVDVLYRVRNSGEKVVKSYTMVKWYSDNTGEITTGSMPDTGMIESNGLASNFPNQKVRLNSTPERDSKSAAKRIKMIAFLFIAEINFADGSKYTADQTLESVKNHLSRIESLYYAP